MLQFTYPVKLTRDRKDGGYVVTFRDIPEAITQGDNVEEVPRVPYQSANDHGDRSGFPFDPQP